MSALLILSNDISAFTSIVPIDTLLAAENKNSQSVSITNNGFRFDCPFQNLQAFVQPDGAVIRSTSKHKGGGDFSIVPVFLSRGEQTCQSLPPSGAVSLTDREMVLLDRESLFERFSSRAGGIQQDFIITKRVSGNGMLYLDLTVKGASVVSDSNGIILTILDGGRKLVYGTLKTTDASGKVLKSTMTVKSGLIRITINDRNATYPIVIDPTISDPDWSAMVGHYRDIITNGGVSSIAFDKFGNLYIAGYFTVINNIAIKGLAKWDGSSWSSLGANRFFESIAVDSSGNIFAVADSGIPDFTAGGVIQILFKFSDKGWERIGNSATKVHGGPQTMLAADKRGNLYVMGCYSESSRYPHTVYDISKWDGHNWRNLDSTFSLYPHILHSMTLDSNGNLYVCGNYTAIGGFRTEGLAKWDGIKWESLYANTLGITSLAYSLSGQLFAAGVFTSIGSTTANNIGMWDGIRWHNLGSGINGEISTMTTDRLGNLYVYGIFDTAGGIPVKNIAKWNGREWSSIESGLDMVYTLACGVNGQLYAGGWSKSIDGAIACKIAFWDGIRWASLPSGNSGPDIEDGEVFAFAIDRNNNIYAGGRFRTAGGHPANNIAKWNGSNWDSLGNGISGGWSNRPVVVCALAVDKLGNVYAGGCFEQAGTIRVNNIAKWDGVKWDSLNYGINPTWYNNMYSTVRSLIVDKDNNLYVGGEFNKFDFLTETGPLAKWDGRKWSTVGNRLWGAYPGAHDIGIVSTMAIDNRGDLYVGGSFEVMNGSPDTRFLAKWDGTDWAAIGGGVSRRVYSIVFDRNNILFAAGEFTRAGSDSINKIAMWDGKKWSGLGTGITNGSVKTLFTDLGSNVFAGGTFDHIGGIAAENIARWNGTAWEPMGSGTDTTVNALLGFDSTLYVGGGFAMAGNRPSPGISKVNVHCLTSKTSYNRNPSSYLSVIRYRVKHSTLYITNVLPNDRVDICSIAGQCLQSMKGASVIPMKHIAHQILVIRVSRNLEIISTGMVKLQ